MLDTEKQKRIEKIKKVHDLVKSGVTIKEACNQVGIQYWFYYADRSKLSQKNKTTTPMKRARRLKVIDLPVTTPTSSRSFLFVGSVHECLEFVRGVQ